MAIRFGTDYLYTLLKWEGRSAELEHGYWKSVMKRVTLPTILKAYPGLKEKKDLTKGKLVVLDGNVYQVVSCKHQIANS